MLISVELNKQIGSERGEMLRAEMTTPSRLRMPVQVRLAGNELHKFRNRLRYIDQQTTWQISTPTSLPAL